MPPVISRSKFNEAPNSQMMAPTYFCASFGVPEVPRQRVLSVICLAERETKSGLHRREEAKPLVEKEQLNAANLLLTGALSQGVFPSGDAAARTRTESGEAMRVLALKRLRPRSPACAC